MSTNGQGGFNPYSKDEFQRIIGNMKAQPPGDPRIPTASEPRKCRSLTKAGKACKAPPIRNTDLCLAHSDAETRRSLQFFGGQPGSGRPRVPTPSEVAQRLVEENVRVILQPYFRTLGYDIEILADGDTVLIPLPDGGAKLHGQSRDGVIRQSPHDDLAAMISASEKLLDRVYGRPKQAKELIGPEDADFDPEVMAIPTEQEFQFEVAQILLAAGAVKLPEGWERIDE